MREETIAFFHDVVWKQKLPLADLLNAQFTYVTPGLAKHYGVEIAGATVFNGTIWPKIASRGWFADAWKRVDHWRRQCFDGDAWIVCSERSAVQRGW